MLGTPTTRRPIRGGSRPGAARVTHTRSTVSRTPTEQVASPTRCTPWIRPHFGMHPAFGFDSSLRYRSPGDTDPAVVMASLRPPDVGSETVVGSRHPLSVEIDSEARPSAPGILHGSEGGAVGA